jgi:hypothetical protein
MMIMSREGCIDVDIDIHHMEKDSNPLFIAVGGVFKMTCSTLYPERSRKGIGIG